MDVAVAYGVSIGEKNTDSRCIQSTGYIAMVLWFDTVKAC